MQISSSKTGFYLKVAAIGLCCVALTACSVRVKNLVETAKAAYIPPPDVTYSAEEVADLPYASQYLRFDGFPRAMMALNYDDSFPAHQRAYKWVVGPKEVIATQSGRLIYTLNVRGGRNFTTNLNADPLQCFAAAVAATAAAENLTTEAQRCNTSWQRDIEFGNLGTHSNYRVQATSTFALGQTDGVAFFPLALPHKTVTAVLLEEQVQVRQAKNTNDVNGEESIRNYQNQFWLEVNTGRVVKTRHWVSPELGYVTLEELKPFVEDLEPASYPRNENAFQDASYPATPSVDFSWATEAELPQPVVVRINDQVLQYAHAPRLSVVQEQAQMQNLVSVHTYWPSARLVSMEKQQQVEQQRQQLVTQLEDLATHWQQQQEAALAQSATQLAEQVSQWSLLGAETLGWVDIKASHELQSGQPTQAQSLFSNLDTARLSLDDNPVLVGSDDQPGRYQLFASKGTPAWQVLGLVETPLQVAHQTPEYTAKFLFAEKIAEQTLAGADVSEVSQINLAGQVVQAPVAYFNAPASVRQIQGMTVTPLPVGSTLLVTFKQNVLPKSYQSINTQLRELARMLAPVSSTTPQVAQEQAQ